jgi:hypothetical protein
MDAKRLRTVVLVVLVVLTLACGGTTSGTKVATSEPGATELPPELETFGVGDVIAVQDHTIVLNSAEVKDDQVVASFTVENQGQNEMSVSSLLSFEARSNDGTKLGMAICDGSGLDGKVLAGDRLRGNICWKAPEDTQGIKIYYQASLFGSGAVVWEPF